MSIGIRAMIFVLGFMAPNGENGNIPPIDDNKESSTMLRQITITQAEMTRYVESLANVVTRLTETMVQNQTRDQEPPLHGAQRQQGTNVERHQGNRVSLKIPAMKNLRIWFYREEIPVLDRIERGVMIGSRR